MFFIVGTRRSVKPIGQYSTPCDHCGRQTVHSAAQLHRFLTLFFIPLIPLGGDYLIACNVCGTRRKAVDSLRAQLETWQRTGMEPAAALASDAAPAAGSNTGAAAAGPPSIGA